MKKLVAMLMVLSMLLSCAAFAEPGKTATQTTAQIYINPQLVADAGEEALTLIETINSLVFTTTTGENYTTFAYGANDTQVGEHTLAATDEGGLLFFSSLYPNTAILLDFAKVVSLLEKVLPNDLEEIAAGAMSAGEDIAAMIMPYVNDASMLMAMMESEVVTDETGANMYLEITSKHLGTLLDAWMTRLGNDQQMYSLLGQFYTAATQSDYYAPSFEELVTELKGQAAELKAAEPMVLGSVGIYNADGMTTLEIILANNLLISADVYVYEGMDCMDVLMVVASEGTSDWQATYEGITNGTNYYDIMFGLSTASMANYNYLQAYAVESGMTVAATLEETTEDQKVTTMLSIDMSEGEETINVGGYAAETIQVEDKGMPSLEGKYVLDVMALPIDMLMNGLPQFGENIVAAMPEAVQLVIDALAQVEGLEFLQGITVIDETATEPVVETPAEIVVENNTTTELEVEAAPETTTTTQTTTDDEIAPMKAPQTNGTIEDM